MLLTGCSSFLFGVLILLSIVGFTAPVNLQNEEVQSYINNLVAEFDNNPRNSKFANIIYPPLCLTISRKSNFLLLKVLICRAGILVKFGWKLDCAKNGRTLLDCQLCRLSSSQLSRNFGHCKLLRFCLLN